MYRYYVDIEILKNGNKYQIIDVDYKNLNENYYANLIQGLSFYKEEKIKNCFDYIMTITKEDASNEIKI